MIGAIILTFVITALSMLVLFLLENQKKQKTDNSHILRETTGCVVRFPIISKTSSAAGNALPTTKACTTGGQVTHITVNA